MSNNKQNMKLYTEEQVIEMINKCQATGLDADYLLDLHKPIELPSDEEIENWANKDLNNFYKDSSFMRGVKYVIDKIQGDNK